MGPGSAIFNDSPSNADARPGLGGTVPSDKDREDTADLRLIPKGDFSKQLDRRAKVRTYIIQQERATLFRRKGLQHFSKETVTGSCSLRRITV